MARWVRSLALAGLSVFVTGCGSDSSSDSSERTGATDPSELATPTPEPIAASSGVPAQIPNAWFVELEGEPAARGGNLERIRIRRAGFRSHLVASRILVRERFEFEQLWNGVSLEVDPGDLTAVAAMPDVKAVFPVVRIVPHAIGERQLDASRRPTLQALGVHADMASAIGMTGVDIAQNSLGLTGAGVRIAIIDSGIDYHHPDLGGCFGPGCKVAFGYDFVGDNFNSKTPGSTPVPDADPDDCMGHGTQVAGIAGASGFIKGVAPGATLGAYRVLGCSGETTPEVLIKAMEQALDDDMRVVNLSLGAPFQWPEYPMAKAASALVDRGVVVVASAGNSGSAGLFSASAAGVGDDVIAVASFENLVSTQPAFTVSPDNSRAGFNAIYGAPPPPASGSLPLARTGTTASTADACSALPTGSLAGRAALIRRGTCSAYSKAYHAMNAGAAAVVIYNDVAGQYYANVLPSGSNPPIGIPAVTVTATDGATIDGRIAAGATTMTWGSELITEPLPNAGRISSYSSWGLSHTLTLKPDLGAPGGAIYTTLTVEAGRYGSAGGTSMASPHVAGTVALLLEASPSTPARTIRDILQNTAQPGAWSGDATGDTPDCVHRQGAGMLRIDAALARKAHISPARIAAGESQAGPFTQTLTIVNESTGAIVFDISHVPAASTSGSKWTPTIAAVGPATVNPSATSVTVAAGGKATVSVTITANPALADGSIYGGYVVFTPQGGPASATLRVPYAGYKGDYQAISILTPTTANFPWLVRLDDFTHLPNGDMFTLAPGDIPYLVPHFHHAVRRLRIEVFDAVKHKPYGTVIDAEFVGPSTAANNAELYAWNGTTVFQKKVSLVPNGAYVLELSVLKALGDAGNPDDWETWTSPTITLNHP